MKSPEQAMNRAAHAVGTVPYFFWAPWVIYLLRALWLHGTREQYEIMLKQVVKQCEIRLEKGKWM